MSITPMTRVELFLAAIAGEEYTAPDPMTRIEVYLDCIEKGTAATLVPMTRIELYLAKISGADVDIPPYPMTRIEMFLAALCDEDITPPAAMTRIELYLANWIENAGTDVANTAPYLFRRLPYNAKKKTLNKIVGGSVVWNQLCNGSSTIVPNGHKYIAYIGGSRSVATSDGTALTTDASTDNVFDITQMFGSTIADYIYGLGNTDGVAFFKNLFPKDYYPYDAGSIVSVKTSASTMKNADESASSSYALSNIELRGIPKLDANNNLYYDGDEYTADGTVKRRFRTISISAIQSKYGTWDSDTGKGAYWYTTLTGLLLPAIKGLNTAFIKGFVFDPNMSVNTVYTSPTITLYANGIIRWVDPSHMDDDKETYNAYLANNPIVGVYELATPTTESATAYTQAQKCYPNGTEQFVDGRTVEVPVGHETVYKAKENT